MAKKILIVDNEEEIRNLVAATLEDLDYELHLAKGGRQAVDMAIKIKPDLVILDIMMLGKNGYEVCDEIKSNPKTKNAYVLFLSARGSSAAEKTGKLKGGDGFMKKPFEPDDLIEKVEEILG